MMNTTSSNHMWQNLSHNKPTPSSIQTSAHPWNIATSSTVPNINQPGQHPLPMDLDGLHKEMEKESRAPTPSSSYAMTKFQTNDKQGRYIRPHLASTTALKNMNQTTPD
jgi:hypothetical protein